MQTIENDYAVIPFPATAADETPQNNYEPVRYNAMKHGILSRLAVRPHEDVGEFGDLLAALVEEHQPAGATEMHLIEELAAIIWRKRRVLMAEGATINQGLKSAVKNAESVIPAAAPFQGGLSGKDTDLRDLVTATGNLAISSITSSAHLVSGAHTRPDLNKSVTELIRTNLSLPRVGV